MRLAVLAIGMSALPRARGHRAVPSGRQRPGPRVAQELLHGHAQGVLLIPMPPAQPHRRGLRLPTAIGHPARPDPSNRNGTRWQQGDLVLTQPRRGQPLRAGVADPGATRRCRFAARCPADRQIGRPSSRCPGGGLNTNRAGFHPASAGNSGSINDASRRACPSTLQPGGNSCFRSVAEPVPPAAVAVATAGVIPSLRPTPGGRSPDRPRREAVPDRDAGIPCEELIEARPSSSATSSRAPPESTTLLAKACRSWRGLTRRSSPARRAAAATNTPTASGGIGAPTGSRNRLTITKSPAPAPGTPPRSNS